MREGGNSKRSLSHSSSSWQCQNLVLLLPLAVHLFYWTEIGKKPFSPTPLLSGLRRRRRKRKETKELFCHCGVVVSFGRRRKAPPPPLLRKEVTVVPAAPSSSFPELFEGEKVPPRERKRKERGHGQVKAKPGGKKEKKREKGSRGEESGRTLFFLLCYLVSRGIEGEGKLEKGASVFFLSLTPPRCIFSLPASRRKEWEGGN